MLKTKLSKAVGLVITGALLLLCGLFSLVLGYANIDFHTVYTALFHFTETNNQIIVREERIPRMFIAAAVGASLAISGAIMQGLTRNPLAAPNILGVNSGASFFIVVAVGFFGVQSLTAFTWLAFAGAAVAGVIVYFLGSLGPDGLSPVKLILAGAAMAALFASLTQGVLTMSEPTLQSVLYWLVGSIQGRDLSVLQNVLPYFGIGWVIALLISPKMNTLALGETIAKGVGQNTFIVKLFAGLVVILLAGGAVAVAGPIGFIGIIIPHITKWLVGQDYRWLIPYCALLGAILLLLADVSSRLILHSGEVPVGIMTAIVGTPFFIFIARRGVFSS
ncbi:FecCD family ABC transporter permease [Pullulanibacillus pueri]|uniref:FecCD family ABC transporter permease n=1 Tax=Pullulanibacillus pueri TaxID=1437324 RepID=UPI001664FB0C|nr:iron ABC transporter permease [Pullulanibacillus pueri]